MKINRLMNNNSVKEAIRKADARQLMKQYVQKKYPTNHDFINIEARNSFGSKRVTSSMILYEYSFNHYGVREVLLNNNMKGNECP